MTDVFKKMLEMVEKSVYCYEKDGGEGYVDKVDCKCFNDGESFICCQAFIDKEKFHSYFSEAIDMNPNEDYNGYMQQVSIVRPEILKKAEVEMKDSKWFKDNIK